MNKFFANWDLDQLLENIKDMGKKVWPHFNASGIVSLLCVKESGNATVG